MNTGNSQSIRKMRVSVRAKDADYLYVTPFAPTSEVLKVRHGVKGVNDAFDETVRRLWNGCQLNLLDVKVTYDNELIPSFIVLEPDYLLDISSLAECSCDFGCHPVNYLWKRLSLTENTRPLLLGNIANLFLDEWIHCPDLRLSFSDCIKKAFRMYPLELAACDELSDTFEAQDFIENCIKHFINIRNIVNNTFVQKQLDKHDAVLEPSYICEALGIQGRLDYMQRDMSSFIEMKSGKADEFTQRGKILPKKNNLMQMLLYMAVLEYSMNQSHKHTRPYLLYTKYPTLYQAQASSWEQVKQMIDVRNAVVANEYETQFHNNIEYTATLLAQINPEILNTAHMSGRYWTNYLCPPIIKFSERIQQLSDLEKAYFYTLYNFITKELYTSKTGCTGYYGRMGASSLWLNTLEEKQEAGEILFDLYIIENHASDAINPSVTLSLPEYDELFMPNFRIGDVVVLYERNEDSDNVTNKMIFKGSLEEITDQQIRIRLRSSQRNLSVLPSDSKYAIEHDYMDTSFRSMYQGLSSFLSANEDRKALLLGQRPPRFENDIYNQAKSTDNVFEKMALKALAAQDYFLLVGPPGTGKTSRALRKMVEVLHQQYHQEILLMAYTNRAVDEICQTLSNMEPTVHYIRIGSELSCDSRYKDHLLPRILENCNTRSLVRDTITQCNVFVGTISSLSSKPELFKLKHFDAAIIDEATQILEPQLLGLFTTCSPDGRNAIDKFVMIGDPKQLPAIVLQSSEDSEIHDDMLRKAGIYNLKDSLFERLYRYHQQRGEHQPVDMLHKQGRMHPGIADFPNQAFYFGELEVLGLQHQLEEIPTPILFIPSQPDLDNKSCKTNREEALKAAQIAKQIYEKDPKNFDPMHTLGIITPYRSQIALIRKALHQLQIPALTHISVDTIERYQGSERDVIIYSLSINQLSQLEWLPNLTEENGVFIDRKLNVALTRARKQMFILGVPELLQQNPIYHALLQHIPWSKKS